ncbi:hypothetical protein BHV42_02895 [Candidatus Melainabacteria bacterium MEL.A1]|nr:hypothetical protein BHV42_02895 [Candidatus Melainabacteria bacterium MEL.A1]
MIIDKIENIEKYSQIPISVIKFIKNLTPETPVGHYELENEIFANIDEYTTKLFENCKFEAHKKYIDIQILTTGTEQLDYINIEGLAVSEEYDQNRDVMFFENPTTVPDSVILGNNKFAFIYPHEAHKPQMAINNIQTDVKKVVVKIPV